MKEVLIAIAKLRSPADSYVRMNQNDYINFNFGLDLEWQWQTDQCAEIYMLECRGWIK